MENTNCPQCGNRLFHNKGISTKNNRPYENYKCGKCQYIKWVDIKEETGQDKKLELIKRNLTLEDERHQETLKALREVYAKLLEIETEFKTFARIFGDKQIEENEPLSHN